MESLNQFRKTLDALGAIAGPEVVRSHGQEIILCLLDAHGTGEDINLATLAVRAKIGPHALKRYIGLLENAGAVLLSGGEFASPRIRLSDRAIRQMRDTYPAN